MGIGWFGFLMMAIFWLAIIGAAFWLFSNLFAQNKPMKSGEMPETAVAILKKRYAQGEISREDFETMRQDLDK